MKIALFLVSIIVMTACGTRHRPDKKHNIKTSGYFIPVSEESVEKLISKWPAPSKITAENIEAKHGLPNIVSNEMLIWYKTPPFKRTIVYRDAIPHDFPLPHADVLQQTIDYRVPWDKADDLSELDGSLIIDRTSGELSARSDKEEINFLALNLADKIVRGELNVNEARDDYSRSVKAFATGTMSKDLARLNFKIEGDTSDPGRMSNGQKNTMEAQEEAQDHAKRVEEIQN